MTDDVRRPPWWTPFRRRRWDAARRALTADLVRRTSKSHKLMRAERLLRQMEPMRLQCLNADIQNGSPINIVDHHMRMIIAIVAGVESFEDLP